MTEGVFLPDIARMPRDCPRCGDELLYVWPSTEEEKRLDARELRAIDITCRCGTFRVTSCVCSRCNRGLGCRRPTGAEARGLRLP